MFPVFTSNKIEKSIKQKQRFPTQLDEKTFNIQRQTFYHKNFKKSANGISSTESKSKLNTMSNRIFLGYRSLNGKSLKHSMSNLVQGNMKSKKQDFQDTINKNLSQINQSFHRYISEKTSQQSAFNNQRKTLNYKNILNQLIQSQSKKNFNLPTVNLNQKNLLQMASQINYEILNLKSSCYDSLFSYQRYGPAINSYQNQLILHGGFSHGRKQHVSCFHKYDIQKGLWSKVQENSGALSIFPSFHTIDIYKNHMILVGGMLSHSQNLKRKLNSDICIFNFDRKEWTKLKTTLTIRSHASTLFGNTLLIHGGIDQKQCNSNMMHFINFNTNSIQSSKVMQIQNKCISGGLKHNLSHHKLTNAKMLHKYDGVFCFGGVNQDGQMHSQLTFLNCIGKENALDVRFKSWNTVQVVGKGPKPQPRKDHSLNIINKRALIVLIGGQNFLGQLLSDIWIFDLIKLQWNRISPILNLLSEIVTESNFMKIQKSQEGLSGHCSTFIGTRLYIFGSKRMIQSKKQNCLRYIQTDLANNLNKKPKYDKPISPSTTKTIRYSTKSQSMWNIQF